VIANARRLEQAPEPDDELPTLADIPSGVAPAVGVHDEKKENVAPSKRFRVRRWRSCGRFQSPRRQSRSAGVGALDTLSLAVLGVSMRRVRESPQ
jgi:hypothetical protein